MNTALVSLMGILFSTQLFAAGSVQINGKEIKSQEQLHMLLAKELHFPKFYAKTSDSLYDVLSTDFVGMTEIKIKHLNILRSKLGADYTESLIQAISDSTTENPKILLVVE